MRAAYVLVAVQPGSENEVVGRILRIRGVRRVAITYGGWDVVVYVEAETIAEINDAVVSIRNIEGVREADPLFVVEQMPVHEVETTATRSSSFELLEETATPSGSGRRHTSASAPYWI